MILAILFVSLNLRPAITSIGPLLETVRADLGLTNWQVSLLTAVPVFCMGLFAPLAVSFNRLFGMKRSIAVLLLMIGAATFLRGLLPTYAVLLLTALIAGIAIAVISPLLSAMIKREFPSRTAALIGVYSFGTGAGASLSAGFTGIFYELSSWPWALASWSGLALLGFFMWARVTEPVSDESVAVTGVRLVSPWRNIRAWYMLLFFGFQASLFFSLTTWLAPIAIEKGMTVLEGGAVLTVLSVVSIICNISIPLLLEKFPNRFVWICTVLLLGTFGLLLLLAGPAVFAWPAAVLLGIALGGLFPIALLMPLDETASGDEANSWTAMIQSGGFLMAGAAPLIIGLLYDRFGTHTVTISILFILIGAMALFAFLLKPKQIQKV